MLENPQRLDLDELKGNKETEYAVNVANRFEVLESLEDEKTPSELWKETKEILLDTAEKVVGFRKYVKRKSWISDSTFEIIKEKREAKQTDSVKYKELKTQAQRSLRADKQMECVTK